METEEQNKISSNTLLVPVPLDDVNKIISFLYEYGDAIEGNICMPREGFEMITKGRGMKLFAEKIRGNIVNTVMK